jgi:hypothetical protein
MVITSTSSSSGLCDTPLTASGDQTHSSAALACPVWLGNQECEPTRPRLRTKCTTLDSGVLTPRNQWCNLLQCMEYREAKEVLSLILSLLHFCPFFSLSPSARRTTGYARGHKSAQLRSFVLKTPQCHSQGAGEMGLCQVQ